MRERYEDLVEEGLDSIISGRTGIEDFLAAHPLEANELRPVLDAAIAMGRAADVQPRSAFRYAARANFADRIQARSRRSSWLSSWTLALRPIAVGLLAVIVVTSLGFGTVAASEDATPDQPLYGVKMAQESVRLAIARDDIERAGLRARFAERRIDELRRLGEDPSVERRSYLAQQIAANLQSIAQTARRERQQGNVSPETRARLAGLAAQLESSRLSDPDLVRLVLAQTPAEHRPAVTQLLRLAQEEYLRTLQSVETDEGPDTTAPARPGSQDRPVRPRPR